TFGDDHLDPILRQELAAALAVPGGGRLEDPRNIADHGFIERAAIEQYFVLGPKTPDQVAAGCIGVKDPAFYAMREQKIRSASRIQGPKSTMVNISWGGHSAGGVHSIKRDCSALFW